MKNLDPTYLRYIHDNLQKGSLSADNTANLPYGFTAIYEEIFNSNLNPVEREKILWLFLVCSILEVSFSEKALLKYSGIEENELKHFVNKYSKFFNRSEQNLLKLNHERLKAYILCKSSEKSILEAHDRLVSVLSKMEPNPEIEKHKHEYLGKYLFILLLYKKLSFEKFQKLVFDERFIEIQYRHDVTGSWFLDNLKKSFQFADSNFVNDCNLLYQVWYKSTQRIRFEKTVAFRDLVFKNSSVRVVKLFGSYSDYFSLYEDLIYAINSIVNYGDIKLIQEISIEILSFFPDDLNVFSWNKILDLNQEILLNICMQLSEKDIEYSFISKYGVFKVEILLEKFHYLNEGLNRLFLFIDLLKNNSAADKDNFLYQVYCKLNNSARLEFDLKYSNLISTPFYKSRYLVVKHDYKTNELFNGEFNDLLSLSSSMEKIEVVFELYSKLPVNILLEEKSKIDLLFDNIFNEFKSLQIDVSLTKEEAFLEKDHQERKLMKAWAVYASLLVNIDKDKAKAISEEVVEMSNLIKNGGVKAQAVLEIQEILKGHNQEIDDIVNKAYIPWVPLGGLGYGQYEASNFLNLSENNWNSGKKSKAYRLLLDAEKKITHLEELTNKDQESLRLINLFLNHKKHTKALKILQQIKIRQVRVSALYSICRFYLSYDSKKLVTFIKYCKSNHEKKLVVKFILNYLKTLDAKNYNKFLFLYLDSVSEKQAPSLEHAVKNDTSIKLPPFNLEKNKTYPPFFTFLYSKNNNLKSIEIFNHLNAFQQSYFSKEKYVIEKALKNESETIVLGDNKLSSLLKVIKRDDYETFKKEFILTNNKFHVYQILKSIIKHTKHPYLYIDYLENQLDKKLFYACFESIIYNNKIIGKESKLDGFRNYQFTKVFRSERIAELITRKN